MMMQAIDRRRPTQRGMAFSFALHAGLLLLLFIMMGRQVAQIDLGDELTEIAYIEARYGEDVAAQVKMKAPPRRPEPPGMGVSTDSAQKPQPKPAEPELVEETPRPEPRPALTKAPELPERSITPKRVDVQEIGAPKLAPQTVQAQTLAEAPQLEARQPRAINRQVIDASKLSGVTPLVTADARAPKAAASTPRGSFEPRAGGALEARNGRLATGDAVLSAAGAQQGKALAEAPAAASAGGSLKSAGSARSYQSPTAGLQAANRNRSGTTGGKGVVDVDGPRGGGSERGRKTILDYGRGSGGRGGGLAGKRTRLVEPPTTDAIVADESAAAAPAAQSVAEVPTDGRGVGMTISGQIKGRKILNSVSPEYSREARRNGWEGIVAVHFTVLADGRVKDNVYFEQTSVHRDLNQAALRAIKQFRFAPLPAAQSAVEQWGVITIVFRLN